ncbi:hypothetical protein RRG08_052567 [Elysia crispata]|uniref:Uncharacterized protein n=1 Tax=Elysia crispata TaxID=231223 RepID=A0AAE1A177_9GAST|nr:hypothetical protein RRG08_052567 [Elysia crispata]
MLVKVICSNISWEPIWSVAAYDVVIIGINLELNLLSQLFLLEQNGLSPLMTLSSTMEIEKAIGCCRTRQNVS